MPCFTVSPSDIPHAFFCFHNFLFVSGKLYRKTRPFSIDYLSLFFSFFPLPACCVIITLYETKETKTSVTRYGTKEDKPHQVLLKLLENKKSPPIFPALKIHDDQKHFGTTRRQHFFFLQTVWRGKHCWAKFEMIMDP